MPVRALIPFFAYFSPETVLPVTSILATVAGILMMLGRGTLRLIIRAAGQSIRRPLRVASTSKPHLHIRDEAHTQTPRR
jgi:hypothetical protein